MPATMKALLKDAKNIRVQFGVSAKKEQQFRHPHDAIPFLEWKKQKGGDSTLIVQETGVRAKKIFGTLASLGFHAHSLHADVRMSGMMSGRQSGRVVITINLSKSNPKRISLPEVVKDLTNERWQNVNIYVLKSGEIILYFHLTSDQPKEETVVPHPELEILGVEKTQKVDRRERKEALVKLANAS